MALYTHASEKLYSRVINSLPGSARKEIGNILDIIKRCVMLEKDMYFDVKVILNELVQNAIKHGNCMDNVKKIEIDVWLRGDRYLDISVKDEGVGFDFDVIRAVNSKSKSSSDNDIANLEECGRGLKIVANLCEKIKCNRRGNKITVRKKI